MRSRRGTLGGVTQSPRPCARTPQCRKMSWGTSVVRVTSMGPCLPSGALTATTISCLFPILYVCTRAHVPRYNVVRTPCAVEAPAMARFIYPKPHEILQQACFAPIGKPLVFLCLATPPYKGIQCLRTKHA